MSIIAEEMECERALSSLQSIYPKNCIPKSRKVTTHKSYFNRILKICKYDEVQYFTKAASKVIDVSKEIECVKKAYIERT